jgi:hypothetical protein
VNAGGKRAGFRAAGGTAAVWGSAVCFRRREGGECKVGMRSETGQGVRVAATGGMWEEAGVSLGFGGDSTIS